MDNLQVMNELPIVDAESLEIMIRSSPNHRENRIANEDESIDHANHVNNVNEDSEDDEQEKVLEMVQEDLQTHTCTHIKGKNSECTICTESITDSSSDEESENFKCTTCSNHVHPICLYNYGIYHEVDDLNSIPCYVCEKGILRPNNSIGRRLQSIANGLRRTPYRDAGLSQGLLEGQTERDIENNGEMSRGRGSNIPHSPLRREMIRGQLGEDYENSGEESMGQTEQILFNQEQCAKFCRILSCYFCGILCLVSLAVMISYNVYMKKG